MLYRLVLALLSFVLVTGCASSGNKEDPWEGFNRYSYKFTMALDDVIFKPVTKGYQAITPDVMEQGISNVFSNLGDVSNMVNNLLQGKVTDSASDLGRILINSTLGLAGLWDPASDMGLDKHDEDFGQTLAVWGVGSGPFIWVPLLGPSTVRDTAVFPVNSQLNPIGHVDHIPTRNQLAIMSKIDDRAALLKYDDQLKDTFDEYAFFRDLYLQNRQYKVLDGNIPFEDEDCEEEDPEDCEF